MRSVLLLSLVPGVALAQSAPSAPDQPQPGSPQPAPQDATPQAQAPQGPPAPQPPAPPAGYYTPQGQPGGYYTPPAQPGGYYPPQGPPPPGGYYAPPGAPMYQPPPRPSNLHDGMTFELNIGVGWIRLSDDTSSVTSDAALAGLNIGVGGWVSPHLAITGRIAGVTYSENGASLTDAFFGPSLQYWIDDHFWLGGGIGIGVLAASNDNGNSDSVTGFGVDLRIGYTFNEGSENTFNLSFEMNPGVFSDNGSSVTGTGYGLLLGYQHL